MRTIYFKTTENTLVNFESSNTLLTLSDNLPFGVGYREECSCELPQEEIDEWWSYIDNLKIENPIDNFETVWRIIENGNSYGFSNDL